MPDISVLVSPQVLMVAAAVFAVLAALGRLPMRGNGRLADARSWRRVLPVLPLAIGVGLVMIPGAYPGADGEATPIGARVLAGLWAGFVAAHGRKLFKQSIRGQLDRISKAGDE